MLACAMRSSLPALFLLALTMSLGREAGAQSAAPRPLPATATFEVQLPGDDRARFVRATVDLTAADGWSVEGCVTATRGPCPRTTRRTLSPAQRGEYVLRWQAAFLTPRCEPDVRRPGDGEFSVRGVHQDAPIRGFLPASAAEVPRRTAGACGAYARLALWVGERLR